MLSFQVKLGQLYNIRGVATQGRHDADQWVTSFSLAYTADDFNWVYIRENSQVKVIIEKQGSWSSSFHFAFKAIMTFIAPSLL